MKITNQIRHFQINKVSYLMDLRYRIRSWYESRFWRQNGSAVFRLSEKSAMFVDRDHDVIWMKMLRRSGFEFFKNIGIWWGRRRTRLMRTMKMRMQWDRTSVKQQDSEWKNLLGWWIRVKVKVVVDSCGSAFDYEQLALGVVCLVVQVVSGEGMKVGPWKGWQFSEY